MATSIVLLYTSLIVEEYPSLIREDIYCFAAMQEYPMQ
jgi:hypothetical protein